MYLWFWSLTVSSWRWDVTERALKMASIRVHLWRDGEQTENTMCITGNVDTGLGGSDTTRFVSERQLFLLPAPFLRRLALVPSVVSLSTNSPTGV